MAAVGKDTTVASFDEAPVVRQRAPISYPAAAKREGVEGEVMLMLTIDPKGNVRRVEVSKGVRADLDAAAVESAKAWTFTPAKKNGVPVPATVAVPVRFRLDKKGKDGAAGADEEGSAPTPVKTVNPVYPEGAKLKGIQGTVYVETTIDRDGKVVGVKVMKGVHPDLDAAAMDALRQWAFKPPHIPEGAERIQAVIPVRFKLADEQPPKK
jgi:TonB family protein